MALLFAGGIMNLIWIAGLAVFVLIEKIAPKGELIARNRRRRYGGDRSVGSSRKIGQLTDTKPCRPSKSNA